VEITPPPARAPTGLMHRLSATGRGDVYRVTLHRLKYRTLPGSQGCMGSLEDLMDLGEPVPDAAMTEREDVRRCVAQTGSLCCQAVCVLSERDLRGRQGSNDSSKTRRTQAFGTLLRGKL
jgi:hypothetical protein